jgi:hypothetical protein
MPSRIEDGGTLKVKVGACPRTPCRSLLKKLEILPVPCQYSKTSLRSPQLRKFPA